MTDFEKKFAEELATQSVEKLAAPVVMPLQAIGEAIAGHVKSWRWVHQGRMLNKKSDAEIDQMIKDTIDSLEAKVEVIQEDKRQAPPLYLYGPAVEALSYSIEDETLREVFTNIIAKSMDSEIVNYPLPSYVEICRQLSPDETKAIRYFADDIDFIKMTSDYGNRVTGYRLWGSIPMWPAAQLWEVIAQGERKGYALLQSHICAVGCSLDREDNLPVYMKNLERLGLIEFDYMSALQASEMDIQNGGIMGYKSKDLYKSIVDKVRLRYPDFEENSNGKYSLLKGSFKITSFGLEFIFSAVFSMDEEFKSTRKSSKEKE